MVSVYTEVEVDVELTDFDTEDLIEELESRGALPVEGDFDAKELLETIWLNRRQGRSYEQELDRLIYTCLGKVL